MAAAVLLQFWTDLQKWKEQLDPVLGRPLKPGECAWDEKSQPPATLYAATAVYVIVSLLVGPPLLRYRPELPFHVAFFAFNVGSIVTHSALFMNSLVVFFSRSSLPIRVISLFVAENSPLLVNLMWLHCSIRVFGFISEALFIMHHKHDNYRAIKITYFLIQLTNMWLRLRFGGPSFVSFQGLYSFTLDLLILFYTYFESRMHLACPELKTRVERTLCTMEIGALYGILTRIIPGDSLDDLNDKVKYSRLFKLYMLAFCLLSIGMLSVICWKADVVVRDTESYMNQVRSRVEFSGYNFRSFNGNQLREDDDDRGVFDTLEEDEDGDSQAEDDDFEVE